MVDILRFCVKPTCTILADREIFPANQTNEIPFCFLATGALTDIRRQVIASICLVTDRR